MTLNGIPLDKLCTQHETAKHTVEVHPHFASACTFSEVIQLISGLCHCGLQRCAHASCDSNFHDEFKLSSKIFPDPNCSEVTVQNADLNKDNMHCLTRCVTSVIFESDKSRPEPCNSVIVQDTKNGVTEPRCARTRHPHVNYLNQRMLCLWDIDDTLVSSSARGERQCPLFDKTELMSLFRSLHGQTRHLLLSQGSIDDIFAADGSGQLGFLRNFFVSDASALDHEERLRRSKKVPGVLSKLCSCASSTKSKDSMEFSRMTSPIDTDCAALGHGTVLVRLTALRETSNSQRDQELMHEFLTSYKPYDPESYHARWMILRSSVWGITLAPLNTPIPPSKRTAFVDGAVYRKMDIVWSMAMSGNWDKVFFIDNNLYEVGVVRKGIRLPALLYDRNELRLKRLTKAEYILLAVSAALRRLEKFHSRSVTEMLTEASHVAMGNCGMHDESQHSKEGRSKEVSEDGKLSISPMHSDVCSVMNSCTTSKNVSISSTTPEQEKCMPKLYPRDCVPFCSEHSEDNRHRATGSMTGTTAIPAPTQSVNSLSSLSSPVTRCAPNHSSTSDQQANNSATDTNYSSTTSNSISTIARDTRKLTASITDSHDCSCNKATTGSLRQNDSTRGCVEAGCAYDRTVELLVVHFRMSAESFRNVLLERDPLSMLNMRHARLSSASQYRQAVLGPSSGCSDAEYGTIMAAIRKQLLFFYALVYSEFQLNGYVDVGRNDRWRPGSHLVYNQLPPKVFKLPYLCHYFRPVCDEIERDLVVPLLNNAVPVKNTHEFRAVAYILYVKLLYNVIFIDPQITHEIASALFKLHSGEGQISKTLVKQLRDSIQAINIAAHC